MVAHLTLLPEASPLWFLQRRKVRAAKGHAATVSQCVGRGHSGKLPLLSLIPQQEVQEPDRQGLLCQLSVFPVSLSLVLLLS